jgi:hypothetical protein
MIKQSKAIAMAVAAVMMALAPAVASAGPNNKNLGAARGGAKTSVNRGGGGGGNYNKQNVSNNRPGKKPNRGGNNVTVNNTNNVNVSGNNRVPNRGGNYNNGGYYNNGRYYNGNSGNWDNDDDDFLEFVGKTAAITAGVSVVAAVIGSTTNQKPSGCQETVSNGQVYMNCNGTWYQPMQTGGQTQYQVIAPPQ